MIIQVSGKNTFLGKKVNFFIKLPTGKVESFLKTRFDSKQTSQIELARNH